MVAQSEGTEEDAERGSEDGMVAQQGVWQRGLIQRSHHHTAVALIQVNKSRWSGRLGLKIQVV